MGKKQLAYLCTFLFIALLIIVTSLVFGVNCWDYTSESACSSGGCNWRNDPFSTGWCEQLDCWSFWTQEGCTGAVSSYNLSCQWKSGGHTLSGWCQDASCWTYGGTNRSACENSSQAYGLSCEWGGTEGQYNCQGGWQCSSLTTRADCINKSGCTWGSCYDKGCWSYTSVNACTSQTGCSWNNGWCEDESCYSSRYSSRAVCENVTDTDICKWNTNYGGYCDSSSRWR